MKPKRVGWSEFCCVTCDRADDPAREWREAPGWRLLPRRDSRVTGRQTSARPPASRVAGRRHGIGHAACDHVRRSGMRIWTPRPMAKRGGGESAHTTAQVTSRERAQRPDEVRGVVRARGLSPPQSAGAPKCAVSHTPACLTTA